MAELDTSYAALKRIGKQNVMKFVNGIWDGLCAETGPELWYVAHESRAACAMHIMKDPNDPNRHLIIIFGGVRYPENGPPSQSNGFIIYDLNYKLQNDVFNTRLAKFAKSSQTPKPMADFAHCCLNQETLIVHGGRQSNGELHVFDWTTGWRKIKQKGLQPGKLYGHYLVPKGEYIYLVAGQQGL